LGIGDWGLGIGPNLQSPIPIIYKLNISKIIKIKIKKLFKNKILKLLIISIIILFNFKRRYIEKIVIISKIKKIFNLKSIS